MVLLPIDVSNVRLHPVDTGNEQLLSFASIILEDEFVIHDIRLVKTEQKIIVAMPNERHKGGYRDIAHPLTNECRTRIRRELVNAYKAHPEGQEIIDIEE